MKKGLSPIVSAILILLIAISVTLLAVIWLPKFIINIFPWLGFNESYMRSRGCLSIENVNGLFGLFTIKNCGKVALSDFRFFIDSNFINKLNIGNLEPSQSIDFYDMPITGGRHSLYITADYAESPPYLVDVPYWECVGGEPVLVSDWYVSKNISCICSYNTIIPATSVYVIGNGSLSLYNCNLRLSGYYSYLFVSDNSSLLMDKCIATFAGSSKLMRILNGGYLNFTRSTEVGGSSVEFRDNSKIYLLNSYFNDGLTIRDQTNVTAISSYISWSGIKSNIPQRLSISNFNGQPSGSPITNYFKADNSNFTVNFTNVSFSYVSLEISDQSNTTVTNSYFYPFTIDSDFNHNLTVANFGTIFNDHFKAEGSNFELTGANLQPGYPGFNANDNSNNTIINSIFAGFTTPLSTTSNPTNTLINSEIYGNMYFSESSKDTFINSRLTGSGSDGWVIGSQYIAGSIDTIILNFSNTTVEKRMSFPSSYNNPTGGGNITIFGNVTFTTAFIGLFTANVNVTRYFPIIIKDSNNIVIPTSQPTYINITDINNQSVWLSSVSGGPTGTYYTEDSKIIFNQNNYGPGNFTMKVSQVCENKTNITLLSNTSLEFTVNKSYNYDGTSFSTQGNTGLSFDNSNFWVSTAGGTVYKYNKTGGYVSSFNSGLNRLMDVSSNGTYLWLLNYNSSEKRVYRYRTSDNGYDNFYFDMPDVVEPYAVDFDGESFWVLGNTTVYKYNITGGYVSSFVLNSLSGVYYGDIVSSSGNIWILTENYSSSNGRGVFRYKNNGTYDNWYFDIAPTTLTGRGLAFNGTYFWVMNSAGTVFRYGFNRKCLDFMKNCDEFITLLPYAINKNNTRYCLLYNLYAPSQTAITFASNVKNSTLDCQWYNIGGNGAASTVGIFLTGANNNTINNCNINSFDNGIKISSSSNNVITNVNSYSNGIGIVVTSSSNNAVTNCSINGNINNDYYLASLGINNNFINTNFTDYRTIYFYDTTSWFNYKNATESLSKLGKTAVGGNEFSQSSHSKTASRFQLTQAAHISNITVYMWGDDSLTKALIYGDNNGVPNNLIGSSSEITVGQSFDWYNFTFGVPVYLSPGYYWLTIHHKWNARFKYDIGTTNQAAIQDFNTDNYDDGSSNPFGTTNYADSEISIYATYTADNIWLKTNVSAQAQLTRKLINWNDKLMQWKDTFSNISGSITARYNVTGLVPGAPYSVYNNSFELVNSPIKTDMSGILSFSINLPANEEHEIKVVEICDYYLYNSSYLITQSNAYYCLISNVSRLSNSTAINFSSSAQNSTIDCVNNFIRGRSSSYLYGVFSSAYNTTIKNCNITNWRYGFYASNSSYDTLYNNSISGNYYANVNFDSNSNNANIIKNNISAAVWYYGLVASKNNIIINNTFSNNPDRGIAIDSNNILINNTIKYSQHGIDISGSNNTFVNNNIFTYHTYSSMQQAIYFVWESKNNISESNNINGLPILFVDGTARPCVNNTVYTNGSSYGLMGFIGCKNITIRDSSPTDGLYFGTIANLTLYNLTINFTQRAIQIENELSSNVNINNNTINGAAYNGIYDHFAHGSTISNNTVNCYGGTAGIMIYGGGNDILTNNIFTNCSIGYWIYAAVSNNIKGGSAHGNLVDYGFSGGTANFTNTNFTAARTIQLDAGSWFNYNNETNGNIWLKTNISATATLTRKLLNWNQTFMRWRDNSSSTITARYSISGLLANNLYAVYDNSAISQYSKSNSNGEISFVVYLPQNQEHDIKVQMFYTTPPLWFSNSTNNIVAGKPALFSLNWTDDFGLSGFIFRTDNTGTWTNDTWIDFENQTGNAKFIDGFESKGFSAWTGTSVDSSSTLEVIGVAKHSGIYGVHSIQAAYENSYTEKNLGTNYGTIYARMYLYPITVDIMSGYGRDYIGIVNEFGTRSSKLQIYNDGGTYKWRLGWYNISGLWTYALGSQVTTGTWHSIEFKMKHDSSAGEARFYLDGVEDITATGIGNPWNCRKVDFGQNTGSGGQSSDTECYFDDVVVSSSYIGPFNSWSNVTKTLNSTIGTNVQWCVYANDSDNNWNGTSCSSPFTYTTTGAFSCEDDVMCLKFDEANGTKVFDFSGYGNDGTFYGETFNDGSLGNGACNPGSGVCPSRVAGYFDNALNFNGNNQYASIPDSSSLDGTGMNNFTLEAWIKLDNFQGSYQRVIHKNGVYQIHIDNANKAPVCGHYGGSWQTVTGGSNTLQLNQWYHIACVYNHSRLSIYLNGIYNGSIAKSDNTPNNGNPIILGLDDDLSGYDFNGTIDEARIYNRSLSQAEIQAEMNSPLPIKRPVAVWSFEEPSNARYVNDTHIWVKGNMSSALSFDGLDDLVNVSDSNSLDVSNITIAAWIYPYNWDGIEGGDYGRIVDKSGAYLFFLAKDGTYNRLSFFYWNSSGFSDQSYSYTNSIQLDKWQFVAVTYNGTHSTFYVNGIFNSTTFHPSSLGPIRATTNGLCVGNNGDFDKEFNGIIDEVRIWNKSLSQAEIQTEMNGG